MLLTGAILVLGQRTVTSILRIMGLRQERRFVNYHRVLNRAAWCPRAASRILLGLLVTAFAPGGPIVLGIDDTIERRRGRRIAAKGIYRDPVRSSHGHFTQGERTAMAQPHAAGADPMGEDGQGSDRVAGGKPSEGRRVWALPFLTALAPSERYCQERGRPHKKLTDWGRQLVLQARRWLPGRELVVVGDSAFAALEFLAAVGRHKVTCVTRLRLDAALYDPASPRRPGTNGRPRTKGRRLANLSEVLRSHRIEAFRDAVSCAIEAHKDITLAELVALLRREHGVSFAISTVHRHLVRHQITLKKPRTRPSKTGRMWRAGGRPSLTRSLTSIPRA